MDEADMAHELAMHQQDMEYMEFDALVAQEEYETNPPGMSTEEQLQDFWPRELTKRGFEQYSKSPGWSKGDVFVEQGPAIGGICVYAYGALVKIPMIINRDRLKLLLDAIAEPENLPLCVGTI